MWCVRLERNLPLWISWFAEIFLGTRTWKWNFCLRNVLFGDFWDSFTNFSSILILEFQLTSNSLDFFSSLSFYLYILSLSFKSLGFWLSSLDLTRKTSLNTPKFGCPLKMLSKLFSLPNFLPSALPLDTKTFLKLMQSNTKLFATKINYSINTNLLFSFHFQLKNLLNAPFVFLVPLLPSSDEGLIQVVNDQILEKEIRFSVSDLIVVFVLSFSVLFGDFKRAIWVERRFLIWNYFCWIENSFLI